jgi:putative transport protein
VDFIVQALRNNPELAIFLTLAVGFLIGRVKFGSFSLGIVVGTLLAGVLIGQLDIEVPSLVKTVFFDLFLFTTGYKVGPQFFRGLKSDAIPQAALTLVVCVACLLTAFGFSKVLGYDVGTAAGLLAGAFSESTVIGTAGEAIQRLAIADADKTAYLNNIPVAYAVTYLIGTASLVWFLPKIGPKLMGINLREEGARMQVQLAGTAEPELGTVSPVRFFDVRAYRVTNPELQDKTVAELEAMPKGFRVSVLRIRHAGEIVQATPDAVLHHDDVVVVLARKEAHVERGTHIGPEVDDRQLLDIPIEMLDVMVTSKSVTGKTIEELARLEYADGVFIRKITRAGQELPISALTRVDRGDLLRLIGTKPKVERAAKELGYPDRPTTSTDMIFVGTGIVLGGLVGVLSVTVAGIPLTLTASGGALVMGLVFGWLRSVYPYFGRIPEPAIWIFDTLGLCVFIGVVGLNAGPSFVSGLKSSGVSLIFVGLFSALLPHTLGILFGRYVLKMSPLIVLGACAGAGTITAALRAIQDESQSSVPALGYTVPYAIGNIVLTAWGPVLVGLMSIGS